MDTKLQELIDIANKEYDGHFTLLKFTTVVVKQNCNTL